MDNYYTLNTDGGSRNNPGYAAIGIILKDPRKAVIKKLSEAIGIATNNVAEYTAIIKGLQLAIDGGITYLNCYLDSELVVKQINREYKVKDKGLKALHAKVLELAKKFKHVTFNHIPRSQNKEADELVNVALDR